MTTKQRPTTDIHKDKGNGTKYTASENHQITNEDIRRGIKEVQKVIKQFNKS